MDWSLGLIGDVSGQKPEREVEKPENCCQAGGQRELLWPVANTSDGVFGKTPARHGLRLRLAPSAERSTGPATAVHWPTQLDRVRNQIFNAFRVRHEEDDVSSLAADLDRIIPRQAVARRLTSMPSSQLLLPRPSLPRELQQGCQSCRNSPRDKRTHISAPEPSSGEPLPSRAS
jgi:hypothetical protein